MLTVEEERDIQSGASRLRKAYAHMRDGTFCVNLLAFVPSRKKKKRAEPIDVFVTSTSIQLRLVAVTPQPVTVVAKQTRAPLLLIVDNTFCRCMVQHDRNVSLPYVACLDPKVAKEDTGYLPQ